MPAKYAHAKKRANARKNERERTSGNGKSKNGTRFEDYNFKHANPHIDRTISATMSKARLAFLHLDISLAHPPNRPSEKSLGSSAPSHAFFCSDTSRTSAGSIRPACIASRSSSFRNSSMTPLSSPNRPAGSPPMPTVTRSRTSSAQLLRWTSVKRASESLPRAFCGPTPPSGIS